MNRNAPRFPRKEFVNDSEIELVNDNTIHNKNVMVWVPDKSKSDVK